MTRFKDYILEASYGGSGRTQSIDEDTTVDLIRTHCKKNYKKLFKNDSSVRIYRGIKTFGPIYGYIDSDKGVPRVSANTSNFMTLLMDNLPSWNGWPKRSKSIICATSTGISGNYGTNYTVIPYDDALIGVCSDDDLWNSFSTITCVAEFNASLKKIFLSNGITRADSDWNTFKKSLIKIENGQFLSWMMMFFGSKPFINNFDIELDPKINGFEMGINNLSTFKEVWIQGKCILLRTEVVNQHNGFNISNKLKDLL